MQCYTELVPASGITHSLALPFTSADANDLVIGRTSLLQIFTQVSSQHNSEPKLSLVAEYRLPGTITSFGRVSLESSKNGGHALLIAFRDAKLSLVEWDPVQHSISTTSIHYYENHVLQSAPWLPDLSDCVSHLTIDPNSRCAAFNFGVSNLAIIPFHQSKDDLAMDDDLEDVGDADGAQEVSNAMSGAAAEHKTPYFPSFVLPLTALDPALLHPVDLAFLHEYRDPTIGILYSTAAKSSNLSPERRDVTIYSVYALDIEQRASTNLQTVQNLPNDIHTVVALPLPVSGSLLVGGNELVHIDQGGKATGISVNEFAREASSFPMTDQSSHGLRLEGCQAIPIDSTSGEILLVTRAGELIVLAFRLDGRSVSGMSLRRIDSEHLHNTVKGRSTCVSALHSGHIFVGSDEADSVLLGAASRGAQLKRQLTRNQSNLDENNGMQEDVDDLDDEDDIFAAMNGQAAEFSTQSGGSLQTLDILPCIAPILSSAFGRAMKRKREDGEVSDNRDAGSSAGLELAVAYGQGRGGGLAFFSESLRPDISKRLRHGKARRVWSCCSGVGDEPRIILSERTSESGLATSLLTVDDDDLQKSEGSDFEQMAGEPIAVEKFSATNHTICVTGSEVRVYDDAFKISQILPIVDEDEEQLARVLKAEFAEPYLAIVKDDRSLMLLRADKSGELEELDLPDMLSGQAYTSATLFADARDYFLSSRYQYTTTSATIILTLLTTGGTLSFVPLSNLEVQIFQVDGARFLPTQLASDAPIPKHWRNGDDLDVAMLTDLGDNDETRPYLIIRNTTGDIIIYEAFAVPDVVGSFRLRKITTRNADYNDESSGDDEEDAQSSLPSMVRIKSDSHSALIVPGKSATVIVKGIGTVPRIHPLGEKDITSVSNVSDKFQDADFAFTDSVGDVYLASLPKDLTLGVSPWVTMRRPLGREVTSLAYFEATASYAVALHEPTPFQLPQDDEWHPEWTSETTKMLPTTTISTLQLISSVTHNVISQHTFEPSERILDLKAVSLETSEITHRQQELIVVGTGTIKGESIVARGHIYLFSVAEVVPRPGIPESDLKLKLISTEDVRGAVTTITPIGSQGFVLAAQGQKCMVRGLREDMSILPVAFMDMHYYTSISKTLPGTGLCILADAFSGLWVVGYSEEPYKLQMLSRDLEEPSVLAADFLPTEDGKELYVVAIDGHGILRMLQYDPENVKSDRGRKLLLRSTFDTGDFPTTMTRIPRTPTSYEAVLTAAEVSSPASADSMAIDNPPPKPKSQLLITHASGAISLVTNLDESAYRRLTALQNILLSQLEHPCGLNPRAYRAVETDGEGGRGVIDGDLVKRWLELSSQHKASVADKVGARAVWEVRGDLEMVTGGGMGFMA